MASHFNELLLVMVLCLMLGFSVLMQHSHNDSLAAKGIEFTGMTLAALLTLMVASKSPTAPGSTSTTTTVTPVPPTPPSPTKPDKPQEDVK